MASKSNQPKPRDKDPPLTVVNPKTRSKYMRGRFLGKGGFAKCYELTDLQTQEVIAGKIVSKSLLTKHHQKQKMVQEIDIHRSLLHQNIVGFRGYFEDPDNVFILLELCRRRSLMELHKRRKTITEPEAKYFLRQIVVACIYLHDNKIIHRDLKLGNLFLNDDMEVKIGDFGLATRVDFDGERKRTLCGTPNYIAPEVLTKKGHSYEVDIWSIGCILYTLLVGKPPFETSCLKDTYSKIKRNEYHIPSHVSHTARSLIDRLLQAEPSKRPTISALLHDEYLTGGYIPSRLPTSCLSMAPRFDPKNDTSCISSRKPLIEINSKEGAGPSAKVFKKPFGTNFAREVGTGIIAPDEATKGDEVKRVDGVIENCNYLLSDLAEQLSKVIASKPCEKDGPIAEEDIEDPAAVPMLWVSKWVDYSDKYGLGYQLCDNSVGVLFNDGTKIILQADGENVHYIEKTGKEHYHTLKNYPDELGKKVTLLNYFRNYMNEHLLKAGAFITPREGDDLSRLPHLRTWFRSRSAIVLHLTNGTLQLNFFSDHTKLIFCPLMGAVTFIYESRESRTFRLQLIEKYGCNRELFSRMKYARSVIDRILHDKCTPAKLPPTIAASNGSEAKNVLPTAAH